MVTGDVLVGDDRAGRAGCQPAQSGAGLVEKPGADRDLVGAARQVDGDVPGRPIGRRGGRRRRRGRDLGHLVGEAHMELERADRVVDHRVVRAVARDHRHVGTSVDWVAPLHQGAQRAFWIVGLQQWAVGAATHAAPQHVEIGLEPDRDRRGDDAGPGLLVEIGAAARSDHPRPLRQQSSHHPALAVAERGLAVLGEDVGDGHAGRPLDLGVGIDELEPETTGETAPRRGLAATHQADEDDRAFAQGLHERRGAPIAPGCRRGGTLIQQRHASGHGHRNSTPRGVWNGCFKALPPRVTAAAQFVDRDLVAVSSARSPAEGGGARCRTCS